MVAPDGSVLASAESIVRPSQVAGGGVEQNPTELYDSVVQAGRRALAESGAQVLAIGLANQGETVLAWDRHNGDPLSTALSWQDRRSAGICDRLAPYAERLQLLTGLPLDPYFVAPKLVWLRENLTDAGVATTTDAWLVHRLTSSYVTDVTTASRTGLLDLDQRQWSTEACELFGVSAADLPEIVSCTTAVGTTEVFGGRIPVTGLAVDQQAALFGEGCLRPGDAKCTYGTGAFLLANSGSQPRRSGYGLSASVAWDAAGDVAYCLDGQLYTVGSMVDWLIGLGVLRDADDLDRLGASVPDAGGVIVVPALAGLGAPYWQPNARASIDGLTLSSTRAHLIRAALEGIAASVVLLVRATEQDLNASIGVLRVDGGLTRSRLLMQLQADLLQRPVEVFASPHATGLGVAALARLGSGDMEPPTLTAGQRYEPAIDSDEAAARLDAMEAAVARVIGSA